MTPQEFCYWLRGYFEISGKAKLTAEQTQVVNDHLDLVFSKITPPREIGRAGINTHQPSLLCGLQEAIDKEPQYCASK